MNLDIRPASDYPTPDLTQLMNLSFEDYTVPIHLDNSQFLNMLRKDNIDLQASRVLLADNQPAGIALIARRGWTSRLAAMGLTKGLRGQKVGSWLMDKLIHEAHERQDHEMVLEVIEQNEPAVHLYKKQGFETIRRLISLIHKDTKKGAKVSLHEIDLREMGQLILEYGLPDLPWQLSGETVALINPPARAYKQEHAYTVISNPDVEHIVIWSLLVEPFVRGNGLGVNMLKRVMAHHPGKTWHVPAIWPEEFGILFERVGFQREKISQWQMRLILQ
jgi:ribosomal protein S18 acetylase RimI-like enzyme